MSLLNHASDGLPNVLIVLFQTIAEARGGLGEATLLDRLEPPDSISDQRKVAQTLRRWLELGLFEARSDRSVISEPYRDSKGHPYGSIGHCRVAARAAAFEQSNNERFWDAEKSKAADLTRSLAWLLVQNVYKLDWKSLPDEESRQLVLEDARFARNSTRLAGLRMWAPFLGFSWKDLGDYVVDPTLAIRDVIGDLVPKGRELPMDRFLENLATALPVLDQGRYRREVEDNLDPGSYHRLPEHHLSTALSRALYRLRREQVLEFRKLSDSGIAFHMTGPDQSSIGDTITHVALGKAS